MSHSCISYLNMIFLLWMSLGICSVHSISDADYYLAKYKNCPPTADNVANESFKYLAEKYGTNDSLSMVQVLEIVESLAKPPNSNILSSQTFGCQILNRISEVYANKSMQVDSKTFMNVCPDVLQLLDSIAHAPEDSDSDTDLEMETLSRSAVWGFGFLSVTVISLCSLVGISFLPLMKTEVYDKILLYLITLAVGTLSCNAIFQLIPEGFGIDGDPMTVWRSAVIFGGFYLFYLTENMLERIFNTSHTHNETESGGAISSGDSYKLKRDLSNSFDNDLLAAGETCKGFSGSVSTKCTAVHDQHSEEAFFQVSSSSVDIDCNTSIVDNGKGDQGHSEEATLHPANVVAAKQKQWFIFKNYKSIKTVAWLITIADGIHNFIDGLAIGASFSISMVQGVSTSLAIFCEEFPHELGDFAILLSAGMDMRQAAFYNFASACCCYIGLVVGILLGHDVSSARWIFAVAGGVFLYISLAGMLPEAQAQCASKKLVKSPWLCFLLKNLGLLSGFSIMFLLTLYKDEITFG